MIPRTPLGPLGRDFGRVLAAFWPRFWAWKPLPLPSKTLSKKLTRALAENVAETSRKPRTRQRSAERGFAPVRWEPPYFQRPPYYFSLSSLVFSRKAPKETLLTGADSNSLHQRRRPVTSGFELFWSKKRPRIAKIGMAAAGNREAEGAPNEQPLRASTRGGFQKTTSWGPPARLRSTSMPDPQAFFCPPSRRSKQDHP